MKLNIKSLALTALVAVCSVMSASAASKTTTLAAGAFTNLVANPPNGSSLVTSWLLTAPAGAHATIRVYDSPTNTTVYTTPAYSAISQYATNVITTWTNYYGVTNSFTNVALVYVTNTVAANTSNSYPVRFFATAPTNSSVMFTDQSYYFNNGVWATNTGPSTATITVEFNQ